MIERKPADGGSAEITGYTIIFGLVITSIGITLVGGVPLLIDSADAELSDDIRRGLVSFDAGTEDVFHEEAVQREESLKLRRGTVDLGKKTTRFVLTIDGTEVRNRTSSVLRYTEGTGSSRYERGAVFEMGQNGVAMVEGPGWMIEDDYVYIKSPKTIGSGSLSGGTVRMEARQAPGGFVKQVAEGDTATVKLGVTSNTSEAWLRYFEDIDDEYPAVVDGVSGTPSDNRAEINFEIDGTREFYYVEKPISVRIHG